MPGRNLYKEVQDVKFTVDETKKLYNARAYIHNLTNQTKIKIPFQPNFGDWKGDYLVEADIRNMKARLDKYITTHNKNPAYISVIPPNTPTISPTVGKGKIQSDFEKALGTIKDEKDAIDKIRSLGYDYYLNTYKNSGYGNLTKNLERLGKTAMNCVDYTSILANLLIEMGFIVEILQIRCKTASHLLFRYKKKSSDTWILVDPAAMADKNSTVCSTGKVCWCTNPNNKGVEIIAINPKWYFNMFLDDLLT